MSSLTIFPQSSSTALSLRSRRGSRSLAVSGCQDRGRTSVGRSRDRAVRSLGLQRAGFSWGHVPACQGSECDGVDVCDHDDTVNAIVIGRGGLAFP